MGDDQNTFAEDTQYPYALFVQEKGWKYADETAREAAYQREIRVRHGKFLNEDEFIAEADVKYAEAAKVLYPKLNTLAWKGIIRPWTFFDYARYLWCMNNPQALVYVQIGPKDWVINCCDTEINAERATDIVCRNWGFDKERVHILETPYYESTDWNYIRFHCSLQEWIMHDGEIDKVY